MLSRDYVWEKMFVTVDALCGYGTTVARLKNAYISSLMRLDAAEGVGPEFQEDVNFLLSQGSASLKMKENTEFGELEWKKIVETALSVLDKATRDPE